MALWMAGEVEPTVEAKVEVKDSGLHEMVMVVEVKAKVYI
jgi:hypothetical protein